MRRRTFVKLLAGTCMGAPVRETAAAGKVGSGSRAFFLRKWKVDARSVLPRGLKGEFDSRITGDPCIVWDEEAGTWRMFYFASSYGDPGAAVAHVAGMALSASPEEIGPGDWRKVGQVPLANPLDLFGGRPGHKWWVLMKAGEYNQPARIDGRFWALFVSTEPKVIEAAWATRLAGPWTVVREPILVPGTEAGALDGLYCDTPIANWFEDRGRILIFYKAYPRHPQPLQPGSAFGSSSVAAWWRPGDARARKAGQIMKPVGGREWCRGWIGGVQLLYDAAARSWYALMNGSPTPPEDRSNREPPPSLGGWAVCDADFPDRGWRIDALHSPFLYPQNLSSEELNAGLGVNFWRHHLLVTRSSRARIFFNSGKYGTEQMYSLVTG